MSFDILSYMNNIPFYHSDEEESFDNLNLNSQQNDNFLFGPQLNEDEASLSNNIFNSEFNMEDKKDEFSPVEDMFKSNNFNPIHNLRENDFQFEHDNIDMDRNSPVKNDNQKASDSGLKKTFNTSKEDPSIQKVSNPNKKKPSKRIDYALKYFKTYFSSYLKDLANKIIAESALPSQLKKQKIFAPNHISYTGNPKESDDYKFLSFTVEKILTYYKDENCKNSLQKKNKTTIENILNFIDGCNDESKYEEIKNFFKMSVEDVYEMYYKDESFKKYAKDEKAIYLDQEFKVQNGFSLLENNGFIKVVKMHGKKISQ